MFTVHLLRKQPFYSDTIDVNTLHKLSFTGFWHYKLLLLTLEMKILRLSIDNEISAFLSHVEWVQPQSTLRRPVLDI